eukprot:TRINITY_DN7682_c0_g1_i1.p2 TRINITY_DN7682_c0_g1~~TRINITY_DN7682_c0_g1_i1.p2  ORF type:complete len:278 (+),score=106.47 TRINITY_DN7682_c0_g1_i1:434-1267(+)
MQGPTLRPSLALLVLLPLLLLEGAHAHQADAPLPSSFASASNTTHLPDDGSTDDSDGGSLFGDTPSPATPTTPTDSPNGTTPTPAPLAPEAVSRLSPGEETWWSIYDEKQRELRILVASSGSGIGLCGPTVTLLVTVRDEDGRDVSAYVQIGFNGTNAVQDLPHPIRGEPGYHVAVKNLDDACTVNLAVHATPYETPSPDDEDDERHGGLLWKIIAVVAGGMLVAMVFACVYLSCKTRAEPEKENDLQICIHPTDVMESYLGEESDLDMEPKHFFAN